MTDFSTLCDQADRSSTTALASLTRIQAALQEAQSEFSKLPFFVRGFVTTEVSRGSGQDLAGWTKTIGELNGAIEQAQAAVGRARSSGAAADNDRTLLQSVATRIETTQPQLERLADFMDKAPSKVNMVPGGVLPAQRKDEFLQMAQRQTQVLREALAVMPDLVQSLRQLGSSAV